MSGLIPLAIHRDTLTLSLIRGQKAKAVRTATVAGSVVQH
jgi:hypothetical protein